MKLHLATLALGLSFVFSSAQAFAEAKSIYWSVRNKTWSAAHEKNYQEFVRGIGMARQKRLCRSTATCITNQTANPMFYAKNPSSLKGVFADCADLPHILRGYYAWMNDLPFSFPTGVAKANSSADSGSDIRYTKHGNVITSMKVVKTGDNVNTILRETSNYISTAMFRVHPKSDATGSAFSDNYSVKISRDSLVPGTILYDPAGHIAVVYNVESDGRVRFIDAHPDNSLTEGTYGEKFVRSRPAAGAGFKAWRPMTLTSTGALVGTKNVNLANYSTVQYYGNSGGATDANWSAGKFVFGGAVVGYYEFVRRSLSTGNLRYEPVQEMQNMIESLCSELQDRVNAVNDAISSGIQNKSHPERLPRNIYGTDGEWESFSTPSRDARFKASVRELTTTALNFIKREAAGDRNILYNGGNLRADLEETYLSRANACKVAYKNSAGRSVTLSLSQVIDRLFALSFDPYHCIEARWGATGAELASCPDGNTKKQWYQGEQGLRNMIDRDYDMKMDKSLAELLAAPFGVAAVPRVNPRVFLAQ